MDAHILRAYAVQLGESVAWDQSGNVQSKQMEQHMSCVRGTRQWEAFELIERVGDKWNGDNDGGHISTSSD